VKFGERQRTGDRTMKSLLLMTAPFGLVLVLAFTASAPSALPYASLNQHTRKDEPKFRETSPNNGLNDFVEQVNLVIQQGQTTYIDPRGSITTMGPTIGLSPAEILQARKTTRYVVCTGRINNNPATGSAVLIGQGGQLITNVHAFIDEKTGLRREPLSECFFQNQAKPSDIVFLDFSEKSYKFLTESPLIEFYKDVAVVRLTKKVPEAHPFASDFNGSPVAQGQELVMISSDQDFMTKPPKTVTQKVVIAGKSYSNTYNVEPIVQRCTAIKVRPAHLQYSTSIYSDCSGTDGASGSAVLARVDGQLVLRGIHKGGGLPSANYKPFKYDPSADPKDKSFSYAIGLDSDIGSELAAFDKANDNTRTVR
jgi:Trypsin-like peptidase domain